MGNEFDFPTPRPSSSVRRGGGDEERKRLADDVNIHDRFGQLEQCDICSEGKRGETECAAVHLLALF